MKKLHGHKHVTLQLLWEEYKQPEPDGYQYSRFCALYQRWKSKLDLVLRQEHRAGEKLFVDYVGQTVPITNPKTGEVTQASIFTPANAWPAMRGSTRASGFFACQ
jgi:transposase